MGRSSCRPPPASASRSTRRWSTITASTKSDLAARAAAVIPGGVNSGQRRIPGLEQLVIAATSGSTFTDGDGNVYTDYHAAFGPPLLGHNDPDAGERGPPRPALEGRPPRGDDGDDRLPLQRRRRGRAGARRARRRGDHRRADPPQ